MLEKNGETARRWDESGLRSTSTADTPSTTMDQDARTDFDWLRPWRVTLAAIIIGAVAAIESYVMLRVRSPTASLANMATIYFTFWLVWGMFVPVVVRAAEAIALMRASVFGRLALHLVVGTCLGTLNAAVVYTLRLIFGLAYGATLSAYAGFVAWQLSAELLAYGLIASAYHLSRSHAAARRRALSEERLRSELTAARLATLRGQLNPHFLFNALNAVVGLVRKKQNPLAITMLIRLGDLLRETLAPAGAEEVGLAKELALLNLYLDIERIRFGDRLNVQIVVPSEAESALVPPLLLQPLVENAIRHGIAKVAGPGVLTIEVGCGEGRLNIDISDNGAGLGTVGSTAREGIGLTNVRQRLEQLYGAHHAGLTLASNTVGGVSARIWLPLRTGQLSAGSG